MQELKGGGESYGQEWLEKASEKVDGTFCESSQPWINETMGISLVWTLCLGA